MIFYFFIDFRHLSCGYIFQESVLITQLCSTLCDHMDCSPLGSSVHGGFSRQDYCSGLPCPPPGESSRPGDRTWECPVSPAPQVDSLPTEPSGKLSFQGEMPTNRHGLGFLNVLVLWSLFFFPALTQRDSCYNGCRHGVVLPQALWPRGSDFPIRVQPGLGDLKLPLQCSCTPRERET